MSKSNYATINDLKANNQVVMGQLADRDTRIASVESDLSDLQSELDNINTWSGTHAGWNALPAEDKAKYRTVIFTDDYSEQLIQDTAPSTDKVYSSSKVESIITNPNLLDNPFFTVNQRGQSSYSSDGYCVDRWIVRNGTVNKQTNGIDISWDGSTETHARFEQMLDFYTDLIGKDVTLSIIYDGTLYSHTFTNLQNNTHTSYDFENGLIIGLNFDSGWGNAARPIQILSKSTSAKVIKAIKLELGSVSTLANDIAPNHADELIKCQTSTADATDTYANKVFATTQALDSKVSLIDGVQYGAIGGDLTNNLVTLHATDSNGDKYIVGFRQADIVLYKWNAGNNNWDTLWINS